MIPLFVAIPSVAVSLLICGCGDNIPTQSGPEDVVKIPDRPTILKNDASANLKEGAKSKSSEFEDELDLHEAKERFQEAQKTVQGYIHSVCKSIGEACDAKPEKAVGGDVFHTIQSIYAESNNAIDRFLTLCDSVKDLDISTGKSNVVSFIPVIHRLNQVMEIFLAFSSHQIEGKHRDILIHQLQYLVADSAGEKSHSVYEQINEEFGKEIAAVKGNQARKTQLFNILQVAELLSLDLAETTRGELTQLAAKLLGEIREGKADLREQQTITWLLSHVKSHFLLSAERDDTLKLSMTDKQLEKLQKLMGGKSEDARNTNSNIPAAREVSDDSTVDEDFHDADDALASTASDNDDDNDNDDDDDDDDDDDEDSSQSSVRSKGR